MKNGEYILVKAPPDYPGKKYRGKYCYEHILVFWRNNNYFPKDGEVIHHKDGNKRNNTPGNLEIMSAASHVQLHNCEHGKHYVELICPGCLKLFTIERRQSYLTKTDHLVSCCSKRCVGVYSNLSADEKQRRQSNMLIREFIA